MQNTAVYAPITIEEIVMVMISNGNRTEWSPIRSVIIRVITKSDDRAAVIKLSDNNLASELVRNRSFLKPITRLEH